MTLDEALTGIEGRFVAVSALSYTLTFEREAVVDKANKITAKARWEATVSFKSGRSYMALRSQWAKTRAAAAAELLATLERSDLPKRDPGGTFRSIGDGYGY